MDILIDGEVVDTYGGDYTYRNVYYYTEDDKYFFYEEFTGAKSTPCELVTDPDEISELMKLV